MTVTAARLPMLLTEVTVASATRLSPSFVRLELASPDFADLGVEGPWLDQRFKLVVPHASGAITSVADADETWLTTWMDRPEAERGHMRTYSVRDVVGSGAETRLVVDVVVHPEGPAGPGADWALAAGPGDRAVVLAPRRGHAFGGIEFAPPAGARVLLVGDEAAAPAICRILGDLPADAVGAAYVEVPDALDLQDVAKPEGVDVTWLVRGSAPHGERLHAAVLEHLGSPLDGPLEVDRVDPDLWETPSYSSSGEPLSNPVPTSDDPDLYAWIAGESAMVTGLRRHLVKELGVDRRQVAFMGYWRRGVAMKS